MIVQVFWLVMRVIAGRIGSHWFWRVPMLVGVIKVLDSFDDLVLCFFNRIDRRRSSQNRGAICGKAFKGPDFGI
jgi:hypothetical protein